MRFLSYFFCYTCLWPQQSWRWSRGSPSLKPARAVQQYCLGDTGKCLWNGHVSPSPNTIGKRILGGSQWEVWAARDARAARSVSYSCTIYCLLVFRISLFAKHKMLTREEQFLLWQQWTRQVWWERVRVPTAGKRDKGSKSLSKRPGREEYGADALTGLAKVKQKK